MRKVRYVAVAVAGVVVFVVFASFVLVAPPVACGDGLADTDCRTATPGPTETSKPTVTPWEPTPTSPPEVVESPTPTDIPARSETPAPDPTASQTPGATATPRKGGGRTPTPTPTPTLTVVETLPVTGGGLDLPPHVKIGLTAIAAILLVYVIFIVRRARHA